MQRRWTDYIEGFAFLCTIQGILCDVCKRALLLSGAGSDAYSRINTMIALFQQSSLGYDAIVAAVSQPLEPKPSVIVSRFNFHEKKAMGRTVEFVHELKKSTYCASLGAH